MRNGVLVLLCSTIGLLLNAAPVPAADDLPNIKRELAKAVPNQKPDSLRKSAVPGMYEAIYGAEVYYITSDGNYIIEGDIHNTRTGRNISEDVRSGQRLKLLQQFGKDDMIVFPAVKGKQHHVITIFTDIDCSFCRKLHSEIDTYTTRGIEVRYLFFPRSGLGTPSYNKAVTVWCNKNRQEALTRAKYGEKLPEQDCVNPIYKHMRAGTAIGISGTPTIVLANGRKLPGYVPAPQLSQLLDKIGK
jgi:thiol:disulfide interchange protein DsbC